MRWFCVRSSLSLSEKLVGLKEALGNVTCGNVTYSQSRGSLVAEDSMSGKFSIENGYVTASSSIKEEQKMDTYEPINSVPRYSYPRGGIDWSVILAVGIAGALGTVIGRLTTRRL